MRIDFDVYLAEAAAELRQGRKRATTGAPNGNVTGP
jgi:hypothetical protein